MASFKCTWCGQARERRRKNERFCSPDCSNKWRNNHHSGSRSLARWLKNPEHPKNIEHRYQLALAIIKRKRLFSISSESLLGSSLAAEGIIKRW